MVNLQHDPKHFESVHDLFIFRATLFLAFYNMLQTKLNVHPIKYYEQYVYALARVRLLHTKLVSIFTQKVHLKAEIQRV